MSAIKPGMRVIRDDGLRATFLRRLSGGYGVFCYDGDSTLERVSMVADFVPEGATPAGRAALAGGGERG